MADKPNSEKPNAGKPNAGKPNAGKPNAGKASPQKASGGKLNKVEEIKAAGNQLRGNLATGLQNESSGFDEPSMQLLKFHGVYQQENRDERKATRASSPAHSLTPSPAQPAKPAKQHSFMLRTRLPGGHLTAEQYLVHDAIADAYANDTLRITTRQCFQFHGVLKGDLQSTLRELNDTLITSLGACGDVVRNVVCCPAPTHEPIRAQIEAITRRISDHLLPRKFKIAIAYPGDNCVDVYTQDVGLVAVADGVGFWASQSKTGG